MQFTKLFNSILDSTIWQESAETKIVWITMLAMCDRYGDVFASVPGLAARSGVTIDQCQTALDCFLAPDKYSRTKDHEGRRIKEIDGGWNLLNHGKYRELLSAEERKEYNRRKQAEYRAGKKAAVNDMSNNVNDCNDLSAMSTHTEAEEDSNTDTDPKEEENNQPPTPPKKPKAPKMTDEQYLQELKSNPAYHGIDIENEINKMRAWLLTKPNRKLTRLFMVGWLNRIDKPMEIQTANTPRCHPGEMTPKEKPLPMV